MTAPFASVYLTTFQGSQATVRVTRNTLSTLSDLTPVTVDPHPGRARDCAPAGHHGRTCSGSTTDQPQIRV